MSNPLLEKQILPAFSRIKTDDIKPAIKTIIKDNKESIEKLLQEKKNYTWHSLQEALDVLSERLDQAWSPVNHLNSVVNTPALRKAHDDCLLLLSSFSTWLGQNVLLYTAYQQLAGSEQFDTLNQAQKKIIHDQLRDFRLAGVTLPEEKKKRFAEIHQQLSHLSSQFFGHLLDATMAWKKIVTDKEALAGLPESALSLARQQADSEKTEGYLLTLKFPSYYAAITYCDNPILREEIYTAYTTRASDQGLYAKKFDNSKIMQEIVTLRHEMAALLNFPDYATYSLQTKMASDPESVITFLRDLAEKSRPQALQELETLKSFAEKNLNGKPLQAWDIAYFSEKLKQAHYAVDQEALRPWFPLEKVLNGLFTIVERLYGATFHQQKHIDCWHKDVLFYQIEKEGKPVGQFYTDLYAREHKKDGAWMDVCRNRWKFNNHLQIPVAYLVCNFMPPAEGKPALLTHEEVVTLFHEFGHVFHHLFTQIDYPDAAGINGVPWDAVELPSQFMENWCWQKESLQLISGHYETGEPLSEKKLTQLLEAKNFQSAMMLVRQLEFSLFDMRIHIEDKQGKHIQKILDEVRQEVAVIIPPKFNRFQHGFSHIFDGGYASGYYSYLWAEVLSADAFSAFEEEGIFNRETGKRFLNNILSRGGSMEPEEMFIRFRGRKPSVDALLRHKGIMCDHN
ncbi:MAG: oligopeptidase A [Endozoicomonadaceae bacterium]|nr:oligopeptidase A [Endozoicomonadaceae bacterium]